MKVLALLNIFGSSRNMQDHSDAETERLPRNSSSESPTSQALGPDSEIGSPPRSPNPESLDLPRAPEASQRAEPTFQNLPVDSAADGVKLEVISDSPKPLNPGHCKPPWQPKRRTNPQALADPRAAQSRSPSPAGKSPDFPDDVLAERLQAAIPPADRAVRPRLDPYQLVDPSISDVPLPVGRVPRTLRPPPVKKAAWVVNPPPPAILPPWKTPPRVVPPPKRGPVKKVQIVQAKPYPGPRLPKRPLNPGI